ncbi:hypothetical protein JTB14_032468 [Gonioctena quinquepunctata]|nr:hypothetical protein JTB14_032468 [Gonioctena quinquepunctata]
MTLGFYLYAGSQCYGQFLYFEFENENEEKTQDFKTLPSHVSAEADNSNFLMSSLQTAKRMGGVQGGNSLDQLSAMLGNLLAKLLGEISQNNGTLDMGTTTWFQVSGDWMQIALERNIMVW